MEAYKEVRDTVLFQAFRSEGNPTNYAENHISADHDVFIISIITLFVAIGVAFLIILPGFRGKEQVYVLLRTAISLGIGLSILLANFAHSWETANVIVAAPYKAGSGAHINASISLNLGLRGFNVSLKDDVNSRPEELHHEIINYNEHFSWEWSQGRLGYGPQAGRIQKEYREAQRHGLPFPILWVTEYFTIDGEGIRFGRYYRLAGIICIILGVIAFYMDLRYTDETAEFFGIDVLQNYEDFIADVEEEKSEKDCDKLSALTQNVTYVGLRKISSPISSRLSRLQRSTLRGIPHSMLRPPKVESVTASYAHLQHDHKDHKDDPEAGNGVVHEGATLRRKVRPNVPVYQNFIRESMAPVEEEVEEKKTNL